MRKAYINGNIITNDKSVAEAMIVNGKTIEYVGTNEIVNKANIETINLNGNTVLPGFYDSHIHFLGIGLLNHLSNLSQSKSIDELVNELKENTNSWIIGRGWHQSNMNGYVPTKNDLDRVSSEIPVIAIRVCGHVLVANSKAMEIAKIDKFTEQIDGGSFDYETGLFTEDALLLITKVIPPYKKDDIKKMFINANEHLLSQGITYIASDDFSTLNVPYELIIECLNELYLEKKINIKLYEQVNLPTIELFKDYVSKGYPNKIFSELFKLGPLKLLADGSLGGRTAYLRKPYSDQDTLGIPVFTQSTLNEYVRLADKSNMNVAIHAIGDATVDMILEATKDSKDHRHGIIHAQIVDKEQIKRIKEQNLLLYVQPIFLNSDIDIVFDRLGNRANESYLFKTMYDSEVITSFGTDSPVENFNPFENLYSAITRKSIKNPTQDAFLKDQAFNISSAIECYTTHSAYTSYDEKSVGKLKAGYFADFIIIDKNIIESTPEELLKTEVLATYINGSKVY
ncbi:amidohydrolase [Mycoplasmatota bacterium]|nr:amidohydrolase [Mycoplasmatota bacterium]